MRCPKCESSQTTEAPQTFKNGLVHIRVTCAGCKSFLGWKPQNKPLVMPFGKHKGKPLELIPDSYLDWLLSQAFVKGRLKKRISDHLRSA